MQLPLHLSGHLRNLGGEVAVLAPIFPQLPLIPQTLPLPSNLSPALSCKQGYLFPRVAVFPTCPRKPCPHSQSPCPLSPELPLLNR